MAIAFKPIVTGGASKQIANSIMEAIVDGRLKVNDRLPTEEELAARFGVSRPTIREALKRLAAQNVIRSHRGPAGGTFIAQPTEAEITGTLSTFTTMLVGLKQISFDDLLEARAQFEGLCCRLAARRRTGQHLAALREELAIQRDPDIDDVTFCLSDMRFHKTIVDAVQNPLMSLLIVAILESLQAVSNMASYPFRQRRQIVAQHERIYKAIAKGNAEGACKVLADQLSDVAQAYVSARQWRARRARSNGAEHAHGARARKT